MRLANRLRLIPLSSTALSLTLLFSAHVLQAASASDGATALAASQPIAAESCGPQTHAPLRPLTGSVADATGAGLANAHIRLSCGETTLEATTNEMGMFSLQAAAGPWNVEITSSGFEAYHQNLRLSDAASGSVIHATLRVAQAEASVTVAAENDFLSTDGHGAMKTELPLAETPQSIHVITRDLMDSQGVTKLDDALKNVAGVIAGGYYDGWDYYRIRGFDASFNTFIDGLRGGNGMSEETWGLESVEVLKGPSSALYGQSVLGGLVNITTRKPVPANFAHVQMSGGSFAEADPAVDLGAILNRSHSLYGRLDGLFHTADTFVDYTHRNRYYIAPTLTWRPSATTSLTLIGRAERDNGRQPMPLPAIGTVLPNKNGKIAISRYNGELANNANKMQQATQQIGYQFAHTFNQHLAVHQNARMAWYQQEWNRIYYPSYLAEDQRTLYRYPLSWHGPWQAHTVDTNLELHGRVRATEHTLLAGVDFYRSPSEGVGYSINFADSSQYEPLDLFTPVYGANPVHELTLYTNTFTVTQYTGFYMQDHVRLPHQLTLTAGGRMDLSRNESRGSANQNGRGYTPRIGITWSPVSTTSVYGSFSKSYMPQSGLAWKDSSSTTSTGSYLPPERGQQWELGSRGSWLHDRLGATVAIFQLNRKNVATTDPAHANYSLVTGEQRSRGIEFEPNLRLVPGWNLTAAYSYINAEVLHDTTIAAGTPTLNAPKNIFNLWSSYEFLHGSLRGFSLSAGGRHYTSQAGDTANSFELPAYGLMDASAAFHRGHAEWQIHATNLGDKRYASGSYNNVYVKPGEPRAVRASVSWNF